MGLKQCSRCQLIKPCVEKHKYESGNVYSDDSGSLWRGKICPDCFTNSKQSVRVTTNRKCRICDCNLPQNRYFNCIPCIQLHDLDDNATGYNSEGEIYA